MSYHAKPLSLCGCRDQVLPSLFVPNGDSSIRRIPDPPMFSVSLAAADRLPSLFAEGAKQVLSLLLDGRRAYAGSCSSVGKIGGICLAPISSCGWKLGTAPSSFPTSNHTSSPF